MAKKGRPTKQKRLSVSPVRHLSRKEFTWTVNQKPGAHSTNTSVPLGFVVRDMLKIAHTMRETKQILNQGMVHVDGTMRKDPRFAVGLFDTVTVPSIKKNYRLALDQKGRLIVNEASDAMAGQKPVKVVNKTWTKGKQLLVQTHDGRTLRNPKGEIFVGDSLVMSMDGTTLKQHLPLHKGAQVLITGGSHVGEVAVVASVVEGTMKRRKLVDLTEGNEKFQTTAHNVMPIDNATLEWIKKNETGGKAQ